MGVLGQHPVLAGAVGADFAEYRDWLERHGVDCAGVLTVDSVHTPRFICTTDNDQCQIGSFYTGAMTHARKISLQSLCDSHGIALVLVGANDPDAMLAHTREARALGIAFAADPSQQLPRLDADQCRALVDGAKYLFTNEYECELLIHRTGWSEAELTDRVGLRITTLAGKGSKLIGRDGTDLRVDVVPAREIKDPSGGGDAFRAGFLAGIDSGLQLERAAQLGSLIATLVLETAGSQEWAIDADRDIERVRASYVADAAAEIEPILRAALSPAVSSSMAPA
jgi:adenosine kinase